MVNAIAVLSHLVIDEVQHRGSPVRIQIGGAGAYAAVGSSLVSGAGRTLLVSGVGSQDRMQVSQWCRERDIVTTGLFDVGDHSPRTLIDYRSEDDRTETPHHGPEHFESHTPFPKHLPVEPSSLGGCYFFHDTDPQYWRAVTELRGATSALMLWEISARACQPECWNAVVGCAGLVDVWSINLSEARALTGEFEADPVLARLAEVCSTVLLRLGARGSLIAHHGQVWAVPAVPTGLVDPTGGGNTCSGALLAALVDGVPLPRAGALASAAAARTISAAGPPSVDVAARISIQDTADRLVHQTALLDPS